LKSFAIIGAGFGDEGKGLTTDFIVSRLAQANASPIVIRHNSAAQPTHTVKMLNGNSWIFGGIGSGTFEKIPTYYHKTAVFSPLMVAKEIKGFTKQFPDIPVKLFIHPDTPVTTPYDIVINELLEQSRSARHGSCGVGFGETLERHEVGNIKLTAGEMFQASPRYYMSYLTEATDLRSWFFERIEMLGLSSYFKKSNKYDLIVNSQFKNLKLTKTVNQEFFKIWIPTGEYTPVFESAQGLHLDQDMGAFPHVTRSYTGLPNIVACMNDLQLQGTLEVYYTTRTYITRHGMGPLSNEILTPPDWLMTDTTNKPSEFQGALRYAWMSLEHLNLIQRDIERVEFKTKKLGIHPQINLSITHCDIFKSVKVPLLVNNALTYLGLTEFIEVIKDYTKINNGLKSYGQHREDVEIL